jgi:hypothetical protein
MRRGVPALVLATAVAMLALCVAAPAGIARSLMSVRPGSGRPTTTFVIRFRHPDRTGTAGSLRRTDWLSVSGTGVGHGCVSRVSRTLAPAGAGQVAAIRLRPGHSSRRWCSGRFRGTIREVTTVVCERHPLCPIPAPMSRTITRFSFRVRRPGSKSTGGGSPSGEPKFGGLVSATTCIVLTPKPLPEGHSYMLSWRAATDPTTPSPGIVYDIYYSPTPGGEDYTDPTWTTAPGATSWTADVGPGPAYFVVRARDRAGREDQNRIERPGVSICA